MRLLLDQDVAQLEANWRRQQPVKGTREEIDFQPVCHVFLPFSSARWWLSEKKPGSDLLFGLCQIFVAELGYVTLTELEEVGYPGDLRITRDHTFRATKTIGQLARIAREQGGIIPLG